MSNETTRTSSESPSPESPVTGILGFLNFSSGTTNPQFRSQLNQIFSEFNAESDLFSHVEATLGHSLDRLHETDSRFREITQASRVLKIVFAHLIPTYFEFHRDLFHSVQRPCFENPFLLAAFFEATLLNYSQEATPEAIANKALNSLNDYVGYRPVAVLENGREMLPYPHERFRPIPIFFRDAGVANGRYQAILTTTIELLKQAPNDLLNQACFSMERVDEIAIDPRPYNHMHPVFKRTNYLFGEWDPHVIGLDGYFHRLILRKIVLDALVSWYENSREEIGAEEALFDVAAALSGTILMASSVSGSAPDTFDSTRSLADLLPQVAELRDSYYDHLLSEAQQDRRNRLTEMMQTSRQPFGHIRQYLNIYLSRYGSRQIQNRELALLYARIGFAEQSEQIANQIPATAIRFESAIYSRIRLAEKVIQKGNFVEGYELCQSVSDHIQRGIQCGALIDPWNILGFHGQFQLFVCRDDSIPDPRVEVLIDIHDQFFRVLTEGVITATCEGEELIADQFSALFEMEANQWDKYATTAVDGIPHLDGHEQFESATFSAELLRGWRALDKSAAAQKVFWSEHLDGLNSVGSYLQVLEAVLQNEDTMASLTLIMQWLDRAEDIGLENSSGSINEKLIAWTSIIVRKMLSEENHLHAIRMMRQLFDYLSANAGKYWHAPEWSLKSIPKRDQETEDEWLQANPFDPEKDDDEPSQEEQIRESAMEDVFYKDSTDDGFGGSVHDGNAPPYEQTQYERILRQFEPRFRFLQTLGRLWVFSAEFIASHHEKLEEAIKENRLEERPNESEFRIDETIRSWTDRLAELKSELLILLTEVSQAQIESPSGDQDSNIEFDLEFQAKLEIQLSVVKTIVTVQLAEWSLHASVPASLFPTTDGENQSAQEQTFVKLYQALLYQQPEVVRRRLPAFINAIRRKQLLYIPFEHGGDPQQVLDSNLLQTSLKLICNRLPRIGLFRETWHMLKVALRMESQTRPAGPSITEFDRLFRQALQSTVTSLLESSSTWNKESTQVGEFVSLCDQIVDNYRELWDRHSNSMRLSAVEGIMNGEVWQQTIDFIAKYGGELFHARHLTLGHVRAILQNGVGEFLDFMIENEDPLAPSQLVHDLETGRYEREKAEMILELVYSIVSDKFDRFLEYNSTTTHSDYGDRFHALLDFLRVEVAFERDEWTFTPYQIVHEAFVSAGESEFAVLWEELFLDETREIHQQHQEQLKACEARWGVQLPALADRMREGFVKPLAVNRMRALVKTSLDDVNQGKERSEAFERLTQEIESYREELYGSGVDLPPWLRQLEHQIRQLTGINQSTEKLENDLLELAPIQVSVREVRRQLKVWNQPLNRKKQSGQGEGT